LIRGLVLPKLVDAGAGLRAEEEEEEAGLDLSQHCEAADGS